MKKNCIVNIRWENFNLCNDQLCETWVLQFVWADRYCTKRSIFFKKQSQQFLIKNDVFNYSSHSQPIFRLLLQENCQQDRPTRPHCLQQWLMVPHLVYRKCQISICTFPIPICSRMDKIDWLLPHHIEKRFKYLSLPGWPP